MPINSTAAYPYASANPSKKSQHNIAEVSRTLPLAGSDQLVKIAGNEAPKKSWFAKLGDTLKGWWNKLLNFLRISKPKADSNTEHATTKQSGSQSSSSSRTPNAVETTGVKSPASSRQALEAELQKYEKEQIENQAKLNEISTPYFQALGPILLGDPSVEVGPSDQQLAEQFERMKNNFLRNNTKQIQLLQQLKNEHGVDLQSKLDHVTQIGSTFQKFQEALLEIYRLDLKVMQGQLSQTEAQAQVKKLGSEADQHWNFIFGKTEESAGKA